LPFIKKQIDCASNKLSVDFTYAKESKMSDCIFCKIIANQIPSKKIFESETVICIQDSNPKAPIHYLIIPKHHCTNVSTLTPSLQTLPYELFCAAQKLSHINQNHSEYRLVINNGAKVGQSVFHLHMHFLAGIIMSDF
jgi:histidine triad (HIT) family protein